MNLSWIADKSPEKTACWGAQNGPILQRSTTLAVKLRFSDPHPQQSVSNCSLSRTISPLEPDVPDIQRFWQPARWESHHRINENIREEKKRRAEEAVVYFTVNISTS